METCRLCMNNSENNFLPIFNSNYEDLANRIQDCVSVKVLQNDPFPKRICESCFNQVSQWCIFREVCQKTDTLLKNLTDKFPANINILQENLEDAQYRKEKNNSNRNSENTDEVQMDASEDNLEENLFDNECMVGTNNIYTCEICLTEFDQCMDYLDHQESHDGQLVFKCNKCAEVFSTRSDLVLHDSNHRSPCEYCEKMILKSSMKLHLVRHTDKYKCSECSAHFNSHAILKQHITTVHTNTRDHVCDTCGKRFSSQTARKVHMKIHSDKRAYQCKKCSYAGRTSSALYIHMSTHANDLCVCEVCSKTFKSARNLNDHIRRVHCKDKKHECPYCLKKFVDRYVMKVHLRCHTGVRPYQCIKCEKSFVRSDGLKEHMALHEQRILFNCLECEKRFASKRGLTRHVCIVAN